MVLLPLGGCGNHDAGVPVACREGQESFRAALARAPAPVRVDRTRLSQCLARAAGPADVQEIGSVFIGLAQDLAPRARADPHSAAAVQLGYLVGAMRRGAGRDFGVYYEARRRVEDELAGVDVSSPEFVRGEQAGERFG